MLRHFNSTHRYLNKSFEPKKSKKEEDGESEQQKETINRMGQDLNGMPKLKNTKTKSKNKKAVVRTIGKMRPDKEPRNTNFQQRLQQRQIDDEI